LPKPSRHVLVCVNRRPAGNPKGSCAEKDSEPLLDQLKAAVKQRGMGESVMVVGTKCLKHCSRGVTIAVYPENVWYAGVTPADVDEICESHLREGRPLDRLAMPDIPWE
jgi:(2Fe-2S) ferredoxin